MPTFAAPTADVDAPTPFRVNRRAMLVTIALVTLVKALLAVALVHHPRAFEDHDPAVGFVRQGALARPHLGQLNHTIQFPIYPLAVASIYSRAEPLLPRRVSPLRAHGACPRRDDVREEAASLLLVPGHGR